MTALRRQPPAPREVAGGPVPPPPARRRAAVSAAGWLLLGLAGSGLLTVTAGRLADRRFHWWLRPVFASVEVERALFYLATVSLVVAWLGLLRLTRSRDCRPGRISAVAFAWSVPLLLGPPLFSHDLFSYLAQGTIAHLGLSPYHYAPAVLGRLGYGHLLQAVDPFWRHTTAPYGPLFLGVISLIAGATGSHVFAGVMATRMFDLVGLVLLAVFVPRLARRLGSDPVRAVWLAVASPLILLQLVAPGHNDLLMAGVMVAGVAVALEHRPLLGIALCMLAATIKLPALAGVLFIAVAWIRSAESLRAGLTIATRAAVVAILTAAAVTLITGFGLGWISGGLFSTPARVHLAITPATDISFTIAKVLHAAGARVTLGDVEPVLRGVLFGLTVLIGALILLRVRWATLTQSLGLTLIAFAVGGPALWPWYLAWGLVLLAAWRPVQRSRAVIVAVIAASFLVGPDGILLLPRGSSPAVVAVWALLLVLGWLAWRRRVRARAADNYLDRLAGSRSILAER